MNLRLAEEIWEMAEEVTLPSGRYLVREDDIVKIDGEQTRVVAEKVDPEFKSVLIDIMLKKIFPIIPFRDPRHHYDWEVHNCDSCRWGKYATGKLRYPFPCAIETVLHITDATSRDVPLTVAERMGYFGNEEKAAKGEIWRCGEYDVNPDPSKHVKRSETGCPQGL